MYQRFIVDVTTAGRKWLETNRLPRTITQKCGPGYGKLYALERVTISRDRHSADDMEVFVTTMVMTILSAFRDKGDDMAELSATFSFDGPDLKISLSGAAVV